LADSSAPRKLLVVATLITLAVSVLRLVGEMAQWSPALFNREAGGPGALVGIVWLIPVFGVLFGLALARAGDGPRSVAKALGWCVLAFVVNLALGIGSIIVFPKSPPAQLAVFGVGSWTGIVLARRGWPALWRLLLLYGFAARIPVIVIMLLAIFGGWDSHYAKPRPDFPPMGPWGLFAWTAVLPQMTIWIFLTVVGGLFFGALAVALHRLVRGQRDTPLTSAA
jgi:hypothetical protein